MASSITERQNCLTSDFDIADPIGMVRLLRQSDAQLFTGYEQWPSLLDEEILERLADAAWRLSRVIASTDGIVFMSGAGTSGRLANLLSLEFNRILRERKLPQVFKPIIAGGEAALIQAQEFAEDSVPTARKDLQDNLDPDLKAGIYIGITCGVSAPYVAAQLDYLLPNEKFNSFVVGFNPPSLARDMPVEGWDKTVKNVIDAALETDRFLLLNPVYGPEPITGSTRMKGGSMTKILIEIIFILALEILENEAKPEADQTTIDAGHLFPLRKRLLELIRRYRDTVFAAYGNVEALGELVRLGGTALRSSGRIHYLGRGIAGILGIIDASECPPTFGADLFDVHGYVREGWELLGYNTATMRARGKAYEIDHESFEKSILPDISKGDLVVGIAIGTLGENTRRLLIEAARSKARTALILVTTDRPLAGDIPEEIAHRCIIEVPSLGVLPGFNHEAELALKLCLNALTTGAHVLAGKIYGNVMIDLRISNSKLYFRAIGLIARLAGVSEEDARMALHYAIFRENQAMEQILEMSQQKIVQRAIVRPKIVPLSILLATKKFTYEEAEQRLASEPRVRRIIEDVIAGNGAAS